MSDPEYYMRQAIAEAKKAKHDGGAAIGAVLVEEATGKIISMGESLATVSGDPTAHAEINCIREAAKSTNSTDLYNYTLYSTLEPCHMCLSAGAWARIPRIFFGAYRKDVDKDLFDITGNFSDEKEASRMNLREKTHMKVKGGILEDECAELLGKYHSVSHHS